MKSYVLPLAVLVLFSACRGVTGLGDLSFSDETETDGEEGICEPGAVEVCGGVYSGPPETEGVGICKPPARVCNEEGLGFGMCVGEVVPQVEICATPTVDENCDSRLACDGAALWGLPFGDGADARVCGVAADGAGNVFVAGDLQGGEIDLGGVPIKISDRSIFVAKLDPSGGHMWTRVVTGAKEEYCEGMAVDIEGSVILAGYYRGGGPDFGGGPLPLNDYFDGFVAKLDGQGAHIFSHAFTGWGESSARDVAADGSGAVSVVGRFEQTLEIGPFTLTAQDQNEAFVARFSKDGTPVLAQRYAASGYLHGMDIAVDTASGDAVFSGQISGTGTFGGATLTGSGTNYDSFIARLSAAGSITWALSLGGANLQEVRSLAFDRDGGVLVVGQFESDVDFGGFKLSSNSKDGFVMRLDAAGKTSWVKGVTGLNEQVVTSVAVDGAGYVLISGMFSAEVDLGDAKALSAGNYDLFVAKLDVSTGNTVWLRPAGGPVQEIAWAVGADALGNTLVMGEYNGDLDLGLASGPLKDSDGGAFIAKLAP